MGLGSVVKSTSEKAENAVSYLGSPIKPYLPAISRFLVVATFYEDAIRIAMQWESHVGYLQRSRHFPSYTPQAFLTFNIASMVLFSSCIILKKCVGTSVAILASVIITQVFAYGLVFDAMFFLRNLSITGGLLLCMSESILRKKSLSRNSRMFASLPQMNVNEKHKYFQLAGRSLLVLLFMGFMLKGEWNYIKLGFSCVGLLACGMIVVGFKAKMSATFLVSLLCIVNIMVNNWWSVSHSSYKSDFLRYDFFQCLSIAGGLLLLVSIGPGGISYDEKKKEF